MSLCILLTKFAIFFSSTCHISASAGAVVGYQGGTDAVLSMHSLIKRAGVPVAAFWMQDWTGVRVRGKINIVLRA